ncbi:uncharacterized protein LOC134542093 isoform X2 [Bacillus rossius redtenbacheri]|uniref:uncharacterized protein LOC134542093 isoform X2 n=1 Tax=Bacillus rossius redtenbacheri TaxID=93214 RepID=UPI002FDE6CC5
MPRQGHCCNRCFRLQPTRSWSLSCRYKYRAGGYVQVSDPSDESLSQFCTSPNPNQPADMKFLMVLLFALVAVCSCYPAEPAPEAPAESLKGSEAVYLAAPYSAYSGYSGYGLGVPAVYPYGAYGTYVYRR